MSGISDINTLLKSMSPKLREGTYVFITLPKEDFEQLNVNPMLVFEEEEDTTLIITKEEADSNKLPYEATWSLITLSIHSDLEAVGFLAAISNKLAEARISVNVISAYYHDHLFVPVDKTELAMEVLAKLSDT
jgi:uncharacterized protein